jgi:hypothetical protein
MIYSYTIHVLFYTILYTAIWYSIWHTLHRNLWPGSKSYLNHHDDDTDAEEDTTVTGGIKLGDQNIVTSLQ